MSIVNPKDRDIFKKEEVVSDTKCQREVKLDRNLKVSIWILQQGGHPWPSWRHFLFLFFINLIIFIGG